MFWGTILIVVGVALLLKNLGFIQAPAWDVVWPILLIILGLSLLKRRQGFRHPWYGEEHNKPNQSM